MMSNTGDEVPRKLRMAERQAARHLPCGLPPVLILTDPERMPDPIAVAAALPRGWGMIYRHFGESERSRRAESLARIASRRGLSLLIAADPHLAWKVGAAGVHWPERLVHRARGWQGRFRVMTMSVHTPQRAITAPPTGIDARLLSTVFPSDSRSAGPALGALRFRNICQRARGPLYALGGISPANAGTLAQFGGLAGVSLLYS